MIVAVKIEDDDAAVPRDELFEHEPHMGVKIVVLGQRALHNVGRRRRFPDVEAPAIGRLKVDGFVARAIQIDLESRALADDSRRGDRRPIAGVRVLFVEARGGIEPQAARPLRAAWRGHRGSRRQRAGRRPIRFARLVSSWADLLPPRSGRRVGFALSYLKSG